MNNKKKILNIIPKSDSPSSFIFSKRQVEDIRKIGFEVEIFYLYTTISFFGLFNEFKRLKKLVEIFKPDIIHSHYGTITSYISSKIKNVPLVITFQGSDLNFTKDISWPREKLGKILSKISAKKATKIICVSKSLYNNLKIGKEKTIVLPSGIDISIFKEIDKIECKKKLNLLTAENYIFFNANNPKVKRLDIALEVIQNVKDLNFKLLSLSGNVDPNDIPIYLNASSLLLLCSDSEGSPMVIKEAMACNLPIISVDVGDVKSRISDVENCFIVAQNVYEIEKKIRYICENKILNSNGRNKLIEEGIDSVSVANVIAKIYLKILEV